MREEELAPMESTPPSVLGAPHDGAAARATDARPSFLNFADVGRASGGSYVLGTVIIVVAWLVVGGILTVALTLVGLLTSGAVDESLLTDDPFSLTGELPIAPWLLVAATLASIIPLGGAVLLVVRYLHRRPWRSVITPFRRINVRLIAIGAVMWLVPLAITAVAAALVGLDSVRWNYQPAAFWPLAVVVLLLTFFQTTSEELFFRGYLSQWIALRGARIWVISLSNAALFGAVHLANPLLAGYRGGDYLVSIVPYFVIGFVWAWVSCTSGSIELAIGAHFINNLVAFLLIAPPELGGESGGLFLVESTSAGSSTLTAIVVATVFWLLVRRMKAAGDPAPLEPVAPLRPATPVGTATPTTADPSGSTGSQWLPPPGWYPNPAGAGWRYWSGTEWTSHVAP